MRSQTARPPFEEPGTNPLQTTHSGSAVGDRRERERVCQCARATVAGAATPGYRAASTNCEARTGTDGQSVVVWAGIRGASYQ